MSKLRYVLAGSFVSCSLLLTGCLDEESKQSVVPKVEEVQSKPNILIMIADDQGMADIGALNKMDDVSTPNIDKLMSEGVYFPQAYATAPICNASRIGLLTGQYQQRSGTYWYNSPGLPPRESGITLAETLLDEGYATGYFGKYHYSKKSGPGKRDFPMSHGFERMYGASGGRMHYLIHNAEVEKAFTEKRKANADKGPSQSLAMGAFWDQDKAVDQEGFSTELIANEAISYIEDTAGEKPFFMVVGFNGVHNFTHQLPDEYLKEKGLNTVFDWDPEKESYREWYVRGRYPNSPQGRGYYLGQLEYLDTHVGRVVGALDAKGVRENTIIVYIGDNGGSTPLYANNTPLRGSKYTLHEGGIRVPLIVDIPEGYSAPDAYESVVSALDLYPTLLDYANIKAPEGLDGVSLKENLSTDKQSEKRTLFWDTGHEAALRRGNWKYRRTDTDKYAINEMVSVEVGEALYDLDADPSESNNLKDVHPEMFKTLKADFDAWRASVAQE